MKLRYYIISTLIIFIFSIVAMFILIPFPKNDINVVAINDITSVITEDFEIIKSGDGKYQLPDIDNIAYTVIDIDENMLAATQRGLSSNIFEAIKHGDIIKDIVRNETVLGKIIFWNDSETKWQEYKNTIILVSIALLSVFMIIMIIFINMLYRKVLRPFKQMREFAQRVAAGELDIPLEMDKRNAFGAFTESFDLMRDELRRARENERIAEQSKRELVASISHDVQTPVASIKAVAELMEVTAEDEQFRQKLRVIQQKTGQIHTLINDIFQTTMDELNSLRVKNEPIASNQLSEMIAEADYQGKVRIGEIPGCLVTADRIRLSQVIDNIIANSYKYADTNIDVTSEIIKDEFIMTFRDYGPGVDSDDIPLLCSKYFRGKNAENKNGYGLGLYISDTLMKRMDGQLTYNNADLGFEVKIWLRLDR